MKNGRKVTFRELGRIFNGNSINEREKKTHFEGLDHGTPYIATKDISFNHEIEYESGVKIPDTKKDKFKLAPPNTIFICAEGGSAGRKIAHSDREVYFGNKLFAICPKPPNNSRFVFYYFLSGAFAEDFKGAMAGLIGGVSLNKFKDFNISLPPPSEQQRLVDILDEAFAAIANAKANAEKNLQNTRAIFESQLQAIFTRRGKGWALRQLSSLCREITVGHVGSMAKEYKESGIPFLRSQNIRPFEVSLENVVFIDKEFHRLLKKSKLCPGDLVIVRTGYPGTAAVIPSELPDSNCSDLVIIRPSEEVNPHFLAAFFNSAFGKHLVLGKLVGAAQKHFNVTSAKEVMLYVPPIFEQKTIIKKIASLREETQRLESIYERKLAALEALKKSILCQAFNGELSKVAA